MRIGEVIRCYRRIKDVGIRETGIEIGISHGTLSRIERGEQIDAVTMMKLMRWLFEGDGKNGSKAKGGK